MNKWNVFISLPGWIISIEKYYKYFTCWTFIIQNLICVVQRAGKRLALGMNIWKYLRNYESKYILGGLGTTEYNFLV